MVDRSPGSTIIIFKAMSSSMMDNDLSAAAMLTLLKVHLYSTNILYIICTDNDSIFKFFPKMFGYFVNLADMVFFWNRNLAGGGRWR